MQTNSDRFHQALALAEKEIVGNLFMSRAGQQVVANPPEQKG